MTASGLHKKGLIISASLTFTFTLIMLIYSDLVWESTQRNFLRKINSHQNHDLALLHNKNRFYDFKELFESCETLSIYKLNLLNTPVFMHKIKNRTASSQFLEKFEQPSHSYPTRFSNFYLEVQQYGTTLSEVWKKKFDRLLFLKLRQKTNYLNLKMTCRYINLCF